MDELNQAGSGEGAWHEKCSLDVDDSFTCEQEQKGRYTMLVQCCVCGRVRKDARWVRSAKAERHPHEAVSHGYCPRCAEKAFEDIRNRHQKADYPATVTLSV
jgi:hypothetical protein